MAPETRAHRAAPPPGARRSAVRDFLTRLPRPIRSVEQEAHYLHTVEHEGENAATPYLALLGLILFFFLVFLVMLGLTMAAYYLA